MHLASLWELAIVSNYLYHKVKTNYWINKQRAVTKKLQLENSNCEFEFEIYLPAQCNISVNNGLFVQYQVVYAEVNSHPNSMQTQTQAQWFRWLMTQRWFDCMNSCEIFFEGHLIKCIVVKIHWISRWILCMHDKWHN